MVTVRELIAQLTTMPPDAGVMAYGSGDLEAGLSDVWAVVQSAELAAAPGDPDAPNGGVVMLRCDV